MDRFYLYHLFHLKTIYLSLIKTNKTLKDFLGIVGQKKGHHRILRQKLKKRHLVLCKSVKCYFASEKEKIIFMKKVQIRTPFLALKRTYYTSRQLYKVKGTSKDSLLSLSLLKSIHYSLNTSLSKRTGRPNFEVDFPPKQAKQGKSDARFGISTQKNGFQRLHCSQLLD